MITTCPEFAASLPRHDKAPAMLFAVLDSLDPSYVNRLVFNHEWGPYGFNNDELEAWLIESRQAVADHRAAVVAAARAKLTPAEIQALGLKL